MVKVFHLPEASVIWVREEKREELVITWLSKPGHLAQLWPFQATSWFWIAFWWQVNNEEFLVRTLLKNALY